MAKRSDCDICTNLDEARVKRRYWRKQQVAAAVRTLVVEMWQHFGAGPYEGHFERQILALADVLAEE